MKAASVADGSAQSRCEPNLSTPICETSGYFGGKVVPFLFRCQGVTISAAVEAVATCRRLPAVCQRRGEAEAINVKATFIPFCAR